MKCPKIAIWNTVKYGGETTPSGLTFLHCYPLISNLGPLCLMQVNFNGQK